MCDLDRTAGSVWDVTVSMCVCERMPLGSVNHVTVQFYFLFFYNFFQCHLLFEELTRRNTCCSAHHVSIMKYNPVRWWNFTVDVRQASIAVLTTVVSINGLLLSVLLLHCVDFVIWNKCPFSFYVFHYAEGSSSSIDYYTVEKFPL